ncbi:hypothetical protein DPEC_G00006820 [Dallia pectoralis]|uniref:Uncharacterized protein n=1 Tax=Dallia pectoralis TaxID=75939 RepID=A0ACC2HK85_DALPE|nr:hypothetical protein DPEC_G00006820 [Dallia pectoralis]
MNNLAFSLDADDPMEHSPREHSQHDTVSNGLDLWTSEPQHRLHASSHHLISRPIMLCTPERDQVVPSFQRLSVYEQGPSRVPKPLPPLPDLGDISSDEAADSEVEFFIDERSRLLPPRCSTKAQDVRYDAHRRHTVRGWGQVNYALQDQSPGTSGSARVVSSSTAMPRAREWGSHEASGWEDSGGTSTARDYQVTKHPEPESMVAATKDVTSKQPDRPQRSKLRRSQSGPSGSFKPSGVRTSCHLQHQHGGCRGQPQVDMPVVPPRIPIHQYPTKAADDQHITRNHDKHTPPVPPRVPIVPPCGSSRPPSPKSLPIYVNGVMPPTQSFAPNPKFVSHDPQMPQQPKGRHSGPSLGPRSPCIVPVMEDGRKDSATHYFLLPRRPSYMDRLERFL